jgi:hypothetical protein
VQFLRCVVAELSLVPVRLMRTRLGPWLLALGVIVIWVYRRGDPLAAALHAASLGVVLSAMADGPERARLALSLSHPTSRLALACGHWLASVLPATVLALACGIALGGGIGVMLAGAAAAAAVGGCAVSAVLALGNGAALLLFLSMAIAGAVPPEDLVALAEPGVLRLAAASALEIGPALWRYRDVAAGGAGAAGAAFHAALWAALGIALVCGLMRRPLARGIG